MHVSGSGSPSERPKVSLQKSPTRSPSGSPSRSQVSSTGRDGSEGGASAPGLFDESVLGSLKVENVVVEVDHRDSLLRETADAGGVATRRRSVSIVGFGVDGSPSSQKGSPEGAADTSESRDLLSPLPSRIVKSALKVSRYSMDSTDSNDGLSPDVIDIKYRFKTQTTAQVANPKRLEAPSPEILRNASQILKQREANHEAAKEALRADLTILKSEIQGLNSQKRDLLAAKSMLEDRIQGYETRLLDVSSELTRGAGKLEALELKYTKTKAALKEQVEKLASEVRGKQEQKEALERHLQLLNTEKSFLEETHRSEIEKQELLYRGRMEVLSASVADRDAQLIDAQSKIREQVESVSDMSGKLNKSLEKNKDLEVKNKELERVNREVVRTRANAIGEAEQLRSELAKEKMAVAKLQWMIENPTQDPSEFPAVKVAPEPDRGKSLTFDATPEGLPSQTRLRAELQDASHGAGTISGEPDAYAALLNIPETEAPITSSSPGLPAVLTLEERRAQQAEASKLERERKKKLREGNR